MYPHGQIATCGSNAKGYFVILFNYNVDHKPNVDEIYNLIDNSAREMGIHNIPVEFGYGTYFGADIPLRYDTKNYSESQIHFIEEYVKQKHEPLSRGGDIANYGTIPFFKSEVEFNQWRNKLFLVFNNVDTKLLYAPLDSYMNKHQLFGSRGFAIGLTRLEVRIPENLSHEEKVELSKEIYPIIDDEARKLNMTDVPVAFCSVGNGTNVTPQLNGNSSNNKSNSKPIPDVGLLGSLICLYAGWMLKRKQK